MESLYHQTNRLLQEMQSNLGYIERASPDEIQRLENDVETRLNQVRSNLDRLDILVNKEPPTRRQNAKYRVDQLKYDCHHLESGLRNLQHRRHVRLEEEKQREMLLNRKFTTNNQQDTTIMMDASIQQHDRLSSANMEVDTLLDSGRNIMGGLRDQAMTLKGAHKRVLDIANTLGLSNTVMRLIERRTYQDKFILYGGMIATCIVMFLIFKYFT